MVKSPEGSRVLVGEPSNVAGGSSEGGEAIDRFKLLGGKEQPESSLKDFKFRSTELRQTSDELKLPTVPSKRLKAPKFDDGQPSSISNEPKPLVLQSIMVPSGGLKKSPMDLLMGPDLADALESKKKFRPDAMEQITRDPPTRRRVSACRTFPYGCGRHAPVLSRQEIEELRARAQRGKASSSKMGETGVSSGTRRVRERWSSSGFIVKESGRGISPSGDRNIARASEDGNGKGIPVVMANASSRHAGKAIVGPVDKGKAILMCEDLPPIAVKSALQSNKEKTIQCRKEWSLQQSEKCGKLVDHNRKMKPERTDARENVKRILQNFKLLQDKERRTKYLGRSTRPDLQILGLLKEKGMTPAKKYLGAVPGVEIGDQFYYRGELMAIGLHCSTVAGIDYMLYKGMKVATCVISSCGYVNSMESPNVFIYSGEGGNPDFERKRKNPSGDQKLERGNLALKNSMDAKTPVRVIHGLRDPIAGYSVKSRAAAVGTYVYDGLYKVERIWLEMGQRGYRIFKFQLRRLPGQPESALKQIKNVRGVEVPPDCFVDDITWVPKKKFSPGIESE